MIAMQYIFVLPADYPMESIEQRIETKGHLLNGYPGLVFKTYLYTRKDTGRCNNPSNSYAPFYLWHDHQSMISFLQSDGFKALCEQFGQPSVKTWFVDEPPAEPNSSHTFAAIYRNVKTEGASCGINPLPGALDVKATDYSTWNKLGVKWLDGIDKAGADTIKAEAEIYTIGYIARG